MLFYGIQFAIKKTHVYVTESQQIMNKQDVKKCAIKDQFKQNIKKCGIKDHE